MKKSRHNLFKEYFNSIAPNRIKYRKHRSYYWESITRYCDYYITDDNSVLELGCGTGELVAGVKGSRKVGIDFSEKMIEQAKNQFPNCEFLNIDVADFNLTEKFDVIILSNLIGYLDDIETVFRKLHQVCHRNTRIIVTYYNYFWEPFIKFAESIGLKKKSPLLNWLSHKDIINILYLAGFEVYRNDRRLLIPYNIPLLSYFFNRIMVKLPLFNLVGLNQYIFARPHVHTEDVENAYSVTVVIPARNESGNIENAILGMPRFSKHLEIIFVEGNSTDDTWSKILEIQQKYQGQWDIKAARQDGRGKGDAVRKGYAIATGDILMILDADLTVPPEDLPKFYYALASGKGEFINGTRLVYPMEKNAMRFLNTLGNKFFSMAFSWLLEQPIKDTLCGTKVMFRNDYIRLTRNRKFFGEFDPFGDFDLLFGAYKLNLKIIDLPVRYQERTYGETNISRFKHGFLLLKMCFFAAGKIKFWH